MSNTINMIILIDIVFHAKVTMILPSLLSRYPAGKQHGVTKPDNHLVINQAIPYLTSKYQDDALPAS